MTETLQNAIRMLTTAQRATLRQTLGRSGTLKRANRLIAALTGLRDFFDSDHALAAFREAIAFEIADSLNETVREYGDFQTRNSGAVCCGMQIQPAGASFESLRLGRGNSYRSGRHIREILAI